MREQGGSGNKAFLSSAAAREWHFAALSYNPGNATVTVFLDGVVASARTSGVVPQRAQPLFIGAASSTLRDPFCGRVHDVRVYNRELGGDQLRGMWAEMNHRLQVGVAR